MKFPHIVAGLSLLVLCGCEKAEPVTYTIPKEERNVTINVPGQTPEAPTATEVPAPTQGPQMQVLPGMAEAAKAAPELTYNVPEAWEEFPARSVRKANFRVSDESGSAEITVTVFPGDVGGQLANVNRWRSQIGLDPVDEIGMAKLARPISISNHNGTLVNLQGAEQSVLGGILSFHGSTWFFKMQGATGTVASQVDAMEAFLASVQIQDDHH